jgi:2,3-bisphosphoglycerate-dependent phosphoglycerate mutase
VSRPVHLVRHGQTDWNAAGRAQGHSDEPTLTDRGRDEARSAGEALATAGLTALYSSDLRRAVATAAIIGQVTGLTPVTTPALREQALGDWEGHPSRELWALPEFTTGWTPDWRPPGGESTREVHDRLAGFFAELASATLGPVAVVTHGEAARITLGLLAGRAPDDLAWTALPTGGVASVTWTRSRG